MSVSVEHAQLLINSPSTVSEAVVGITKADLQPAGQTIGTPRNVAIATTGLSINGSVVALQWQQGGVIGVDAALVTFAPGVVDGRRAIPVGVGVPAIAGQDIQFQLSSGSWMMAVDRAQFSPVGSDVQLDDNRFFVVGTPLLSPSTIVLSENAVVAPAALSISGQDVTLTWNQGSLLIIPAALSPAGQDIGLNKSWSLAVDSAAPQIVGRNIVFDWVVSNTIVVEPALLSLVGSALNLAREIEMTPATMQAAGNTIGRGWGTVVGTVQLEASPQNVDFIYQYVLGYSFGPASVSMDGKDISMYLGSGAPTLYRLNHTYPAIEISLQSPKAAKYQDSGKILNA